MLKRLKAALLALLGEPAKQEDQSPAASCSMQSIRQAFGMPDATSSESAANFDGHAWNLLNQLFHNYHSVGDIAGASSIADRMRRMAIGYIEDKEQAAHRQEIADAAGPGATGSGTQGRL